MIAGRKMDSGLIKILDFTKLYESQVCNLPFVATSTRRVSRQRRDVYVCNISFHAREILIANCLISIITYFENI